MKRLDETRTLGLALIGLFAVGMGWAQEVPPRQFFQVATGSTAGSYFPVGELIAGIVSHPPGLARCDAPGVCGPDGLIVSARTSEGAVANVLAVNAGETDSGLAQGNVVADAVAGRGEFRAHGRQKHLRAIASLFAEPVQLVAAADSHIANVSDLRGKRVSINTEGSGVGVVARAILEAYGLSEQSIKAGKEPYDVSADLLKRKKLDAFFFLGSAPAPLIEDLFAHGAARLVPIDGRARRQSRHRNRRDGVEPYLVGGPGHGFSGYRLWAVAGAVPSRQSRAVEWGRAGRPAHPPR
jgi:hypothetical protein